MDKILTALEEPKFDKWRETRIEYTESMGEAYKSISIETFMTYEELSALTRELKGADA